MRRIGCVMSTLTLSILSLGLWFMLGHSPLVLADGLSGTFKAYAWQTLPAGYTDNSAIPMFWVNKADIDGGKWSQVADNASAFWQSLPSGSPHVLLDGDIFYQIMYVQNSTLDPILDAQNRPTPYPGIWWDNGSVLIRDYYYDSLFNQLSSRTTVDAFIVDFEHPHNCFEMSDINQCNALTYDGRYPAVHERMHTPGWWVDHPSYPYPTNPPSSSELYTVAYWWTFNNTSYSVDHLIWDALALERTAFYIQHVFDKAVYYFPNIKSCNWEGYKNTTTQPALGCPTSYGHRIYSYLGDAHAGSHQCVSAYGELNSITTTNPPEGVSAYPKTAFNGFRHAVNKVRSAVSMSPTVPIMPWIAFREWPNGTTNNTDFYQEIIFHVGLCNPTAFLWWNAQASSYLDPEDWCQPATMTLTCNCLHQLDKLVGYSGRATLVNSLSGWGDNYTLTGMSAGGRQVWRFTPDLATTGDTLPGVVASDPNDPVDNTMPVRFQVGQTLISFPVGSAIYQLTPSETYSSLGYWVTSPLNTAPTVTTNIRPTVALSSPANSATYTLGGTYSLTATASDSDNGVAKVEFYDGNTRLASVTSSNTTYTYNWTPPASAVGYHTVTARAIDNAGVRTISAPANIWLMQWGSGLKGDYYNLDNLSNLAFSRTDPAVNFTWTSSPVSSDNYSVEWNGFINTSYSEPYTFYATAQTGCRVWINNTLLIDQWDNCSTEASGTISLVASIKYPIKVDYRHKNGSGTGSVALKWCSTHTSKDVVPYYRLFPADARPTVNLVSPAANTVFSPPATITLQAAAADNDSIVSNVTFYDNGTVLGQATTAPLTYAWNPSTAGIHLLTAVVNSKDGDNATSAAVPVRINVLPMVTLNVPDNTVFYCGLQKFSFTATASDPDGAISRVVFYDNYTGVKTKIGIADNVSGQTFILNNRDLPPTLQTSGLGLHRFTAVAVDNDSGRTTSGEVQLMLTNYLETHDWHDNVYDSDTIRAHVNSNRDNANNDDNYSSSKPQQGDWIFDNCSFDATRNQLHIWSASHIDFGGYIMPVGWGNDTDNSRVVIKIKLSESVTSVTWDLPSSYLGIQSNSSVQAKYSTDGVHFITCYTMPKLSGVNFNAPPVTFSVPATDVIYLAIYGTYGGGRAGYTLYSLGTVTFVPGNTTPQWTANTYSNDDEAIRENVNGGMDMGGIAYQSFKPADNSSWKVNYSLNPKTGPVNIWSANNICFSTCVGANGDGNTSNSVVIRIDLSDNITKFSWDLPSTYFITDASNHVDFKYSVNGDNFTTCYSVPSGTGYTDPASIDNISGFPSTRTLYIGYFATRTDWYAKALWTSTGDLTFFP